MSIFDDRERAYEAKFLMDENATFLISVRRDKLLGLWAATLMGLDQEAAKAYAKSVVDSDLEHHDIIRKIAHDICSSGDHVDETTVLSYLHDCHEQAREQIFAELGLK